MKVAVAQFQVQDNRKSCNIHRIRELGTAAAERGAELLLFHEMCICGYTHTSELDRGELSALSEPLHGESVQQLQEIAGDLGLAIGAGFVEQDGSCLYNSYVCLDGSGVLACHRKLHPFINPHLSPGNSYTTFELGGWTFGILICYDNNIIENVRANALLGVDAIIAPHVTGCTPSSMPGRGFVDDELWQNREEDPVPLRMEFDGPKGRGWLMRWLPARAYDNGVYYLFSNPIGYEGGQLKNGNSMILDPYGEILAECRSFDDDYVVAKLSRNKLSRSGGRRYIEARRPELYREILGAGHKGKTKTSWLGRRS